MKEKFKTIKRSWDYIKPYNTLVIFYLVVGTIFSLISLVPPFIVANMMTSITSGTVNQIMILSFALLGFKLFGTISSYFWDFIYFKIASILVLDIRRDVSTAITNLEIQNFDKNNSGVFIKRMDDDPYHIIRFFDSLSMATSEIIANAGVFIFLFALNIYMGLLMLLSLIPIYYIQKIRVKDRMEQMKIWRKIDEDNQGIFNEMLKGVRDIKVLNLKEPFLNHLLVYLKNFQEKGFNIDSRNRMFWAFDHGIKDIITFILLLVGAFFIQENIIVPTVLITVYLYQDRILVMIDRISNLVGGYKEFELAANRIFEVSDYTTFSKEIFGSKVLDHVQGMIEFKNVVFGYGEQTVVNGLNLEIKANDTVAIVGKSGGGKSTLFALLSKMYNIQSGDILIDGVSIKELSEESIRNNISYITQSPYLFNMSVKENLRLVKTNLTEEEMIEKCKLAAIHEFIMTLPNQYETIIGEGGITLSGGQRQRLAIARALIKNSKIILFDEATSALDNETQKEIQKSIDNISSDYTILIIAHRLSTVTTCNRIVVIDQGQVNGIGTHEELLQSNTIYQDLYRSNLE